MDKNQIIARNNISIFGCDSGQTMLFAHGYGCDQHMWRFVTPAFEATYQIVLFDHVGSGQSDRSAYHYPKYATLQGYADDIIEICEALALRNVVLVGHSVSSMIGLLAAVHRPDLFASLIMVGPSACYINDQDYKGGFTRADIDELLENLDYNYLGWSSAMAPVIMGNTDRPQLAQELENSFCQNDPKIAKHFAQTTFLSDNRKDLPLLKTPTLVLQCTQDVIAPIAVGQYIHQHLPNSVFTLLKASGHCPHLSEPEETLSAIKMFLKSND
jgi:sigma-B regulation protein RsbQ